MYKQKNAQLRAKMSALFVRMCPNRGNLFSGNEFCHFRDFRLNATVR